MTDELCTRCGVELNDGDMVTAAPVEDDGWLWFHVECYRAAYPRSVWQRLGAQVYLLRQRVCGVFGHRMWPSGAWSEAGMQSVSETCSRCRLVASLLSQTDQDEVS